MTAFDIVTGPGNSLPGPLAAALAVAFAVIAAGVPLGVFTIRRPDRRDRQLRRLLVEETARMADDPMRDPNWCYTHGRICAPCPTPPPEPRR